MWFFFRRSQWKVRQVGVGVAGKSPFNTGKSARKINGETDGEISKANGSFW